jgi:2-dehydro-3-deoxyphosphogluconate aldolase / (4S)-4-hydroxy-2-oxoglutarate aldolase
MTQRQTALIRFVLARGVAAFPGAYMPAEVLTAMNLGATTVKLIPASAGGPDNLDAGVVAVAVGGPMLEEPDSAGDLHAMAERARSALRLASAGRTA